MTSTNSTEAYGILLEEKEECSTTSKVELHNSLSKDASHGKVCVGSSKIRNYDDKSTFLGEKEKSGRSQDDDHNKECIISSNLDQNVYDKDKAIFLEEMKESNSTSEVGLLNFNGKDVDQNKTSSRIAHGREKAIFSQQEEQQLSGSAEQERYHSQEETTDPGKESNASSKKGGAEEILLLQQIIEQLQDEILSLRRRRAEEGRANEKVVSIFASREYSWKAEKRKLISDQRRLWEELQRSFMDQQFLKQTSQHMRNIQLESECEECHRKEGFLLELKERFREQEFVVMASMEELKTEQEEKNMLKGKLVLTESELSRVNEKLLIESESHSAELCQGQTMINELQMALAELQSAQKASEEQKMQALQDLESALNSLTDLKKDKEHYEELVRQMSSEIATLRNASEEKESKMAEMVEKAERDAEEKQELERQITIANAKFLHAESEKEKWRKLHNSHVLKETNSHGNSKNRIDPEFDKLKELQRLHDEELQALRSAFDEDVKFLQKKLEAVQGNASLSEQSSLARKTKHKKHLSSLEAGQSHTGETQSGILMGCSDYSNSTNKIKAALSQSVSSDTHSEKQLRKWKKAYFASKATLDMLQKGPIDSVSHSRRSPALQDWLELEKARSKMEQMHIQEINAFDRQLKARDERMEAFRQQLLTMEREAKEHVAQIEELRRALGTSREENVRLHELLKVSEKENEQT